MTYTSAGTSGVTDENGRYDYDPGDVLTFSIAGHDFAPVIASRYITILDLFESVYIDQRVLNLGRTPGKSS